MERGVFDLETGEILTTLESGDRILRSESIKSYKKKSTRGFLKVDPIEIRYLLNDLDRNEMAVLFAMQPFVSYESCLLKKPNGKDLTFDNLVEILHMSRSPVNEALNGLIDKNVIYKGRNGRNVQYFMNPWIAYKGPCFNLTLKDMFKNYKIRSKGNITWGELNE